MNKHSFTFTSLRVVFVKAIKTDIPSARSSLHGTASAEQSSSNLHNNFDPVSHHPTVNIKYTLGCKRSRLMNR